MTQYLTKKSLKSLINNKIHIMRKQFISVALFAVLATMAVICQKENIMDLPNSAVEVGTVRTVSYTVDA